MDEIKARQEVSDRARSMKDTDTQMQAEEALNESEQKYKLLIEATNTGYVIIDEKGRVLDANQEYVRMTGRGRIEDVLGRPVTDWTASYDLERNADEVRKCMESGSVRNLVIDYVDHQGKTTPVEITATVLPGATCARIFTICRDITERKRMEEALQKSERMLQTIIDTEPDCIKVIDEESRLIMMNRAGLNMIQADSLDEVRGQFVCPLVAPEYQQAFMDMTRQIFQGGSGSLEFRMVGMRGSQLRLETHAVPLRNEKNEIIALLGVTRDITERKKVEETLRESEERFKAITMTASDAILLMDDRGKLIHWNPAAERIFGYPAEEALGKDLHPSLPPNNCTIII